MADEQTRDQYKFPIQLRYAMERAATVLNNLANAKNRELDEDCQAIMRRSLDELENACAEANLAARRAAPIAAQLDAEELPALPEKIGTIYPGNYWTGLSSANPPGKPLADVYTAEQVRQAQREAVSAYIDGRTVVQSDPSKEQTK